MQPPAPDNLSPATHAEAMKRLREASGQVRIDSRLVSFLYTLMRDHLPPGTVETIALDCTVSDTLYSNGWLARYAEDVAKRLADDPKPDPV